jgi:hypothetical protein
VTWTGRFARDLANESGDMELLVSRPRLVLDHLNVIKMKVQLEINGGEVESGRLLAGGRVGNRHGKRRLAYDL